MRKLIKCLGRFVQKLWNKIFGKKKKIEEPQPINEWKNFTLGPGEVYIDGTPIGKVQSITSLSKEDFGEEWEERIRKIFEDGEINLGTLNLLPQTEIQKNFFNIPLTNLPKRYWCKTLILTLTANQESEYQAVDMSQYEEHKIANFIVGRKEGWDEVIQEYLSEQEFETDEEFQEEEEWLAEVRQVAEADGFYSAIMGEATLLHYEDLGVWDIEN